jgi:two-component sensor histidine kinase
VASIEQHLICRVLILSLSVTLYPIHWLTRDSVAGFESGKPLRPLIAFQSENIFTFTGTSMVVFKILSIGFIMLLTGLSSYSQEQPKESTAKLYRSLRTSSPDTSRINILYKLGNYYLFLPGERKSDLDSAFTFLKMGSELSDNLHSSEWHYKILTSVALCYFETGKPDTAETLLKQVIAYYQKEGDELLEANAWERLGTYLINVPKSNRAEALGYTQKAIRLYKKNGNQFKVLELQGEQAAALFMDRKFDESEKIFLRMRDGFKKIHYYGDVNGYVLDWLGSIAAKKSEFNKELFFALENLDNLQKHPKDFSASREEILYFRLSEIYRELDNMPKSEFYSKKELPIALKLGIDYTYSLHNLIPSILKQGRPADALKILQETVKKSAPNVTQRIDVNQLFGQIYAAMHDDQKAEYYYRRGFDFYQQEDPKHENLELFSRTYQNMSDFYASINQFKKAEPFLTEMNTKSLPISPLQKSKLALVQSRVDSAAGRYLSALKSYQVHKRLNDSTFNVQKSRQISQLEVSFETKQKQAKIDLLDAQSKSSLAQAQRANLQRNVTAAGILIMFIISGITFNSVRNKVKSNRLLTAKKEEIDLQNENLQILLSEKEELLTEKEILLGDKDMLLKEVHHRVKNNLQIVMSLLSTQVAYLENKDAVKAVEESQQRVQAIALIHQKLYRETAGVTIQMQSYVEDMVDDLASFFDAYRKGIRFKAAVDEIYLDIDQAVPLGLILNEALTNAIKYAFEKEGGIVTISLQKQDNEKSYALTVKDNGRGLPADFNLERVNSLGMVMMKGLTGQLGGFFKVFNETGLTLTLTFPARVNNLIKIQN